MCIVSVILYSLIKYGLIKPFQFIVKPFNTNHIADQLVLEVTEYRKAAREMNRKNEQQSEDSSVVETSVNDGDLTIEKL